MRKARVMDIKRLQLTILDTLKVLYLFSKRVYRCQGDGFLSMGAQTAPLNSHWLVLRIGGADFLHCWVTDSILFERVGSLITKR